MRSKREASSFGDDAYFGMRSGGAELAYRRVYFRARLTVVLAATLLERLGATDCSETQGP